MKHNTEQRESITHKAAPTTDSATDKPAPVAAHMNGEVDVKNL